MTLTSRIARTGAVVALVAAVAAPAYADTGTAIEGSPQPDGAPVLTAGTYSDTVKSGETLYYAVKLQIGQSAKGRFTVDGTKTDPDVGGGGQIWAVTEDGDEYAFDNACCHRADAWTMTTETGPVGSESSHAKEPGRYYFKYHLTGYDAGVTVPVKIAVIVSGEGIAGATDPAASSDGGSPASGAGSAGESTTASDGESSPQAVAAAPAPEDTGIRLGLPIVLGVGIAGLLVGLVGGSVVTAAISAARSRRRPY